MDQQREQSGAYDNARGSASDGAENAVDDRIEHAGVGHDAEVEDCEHEHAGDRGDAGDAGEDELAGREAETADQRRHDRRRDQRHERRQKVEHDHGQQHNDRKCAEQREHVSSSSVSFFVFGGQRPRSKEY
jgi:hypothetical protein